MLRYNGVVSIRPSVMMEVAQWANWCVTLCTYLYSHAASYISQVRGNFEWISYYEFSSPPSADNYRLQLYKNTLAAVHHPDSNV